jgi:TetR/AcrR family transcriptional regulator, regulator of cefoperazone and chloramphenicol sensitivity
MMSYPMEGPDTEDLTARARIRDAALRLFADKGIDGVSVRDIARAAGVSSKLIRHHFGSKEALRDACDSYAIDRLMRIKEQVIEEGKLADPEFLPGIEPLKLLYHRYLGRSMIDGSSAAESRFDAMVDLAEQWLIRHRPDAADPRACAAVLVGMQAGLLVLYDQVLRALGSDPHSVEGNLRISRGMVYLYATPLLSADLVAQAGAAYDRMQRRQTSTNESPRSTKEAEEGAQP